MLHDTGPADGPAANAVPDPATDRKNCVLGGVNVGSPKVKTALEYSLAEGSCCSVMYALVDTFAVAAAVSLAAPAMAIAVMGSLPLFLSSLAQYLLPSVINTSRGRSFYVTWGVGLQAGSLLLCSLSGFLPRQWGAAAFIVTFMLYVLTGNTTGSLWMAWMKDLIPQQVRGRHFAWRNRIFNTIQLGASVVTGIVARSYTAETAPWTLYTVLFSLASLFRFCSAYFLTKQHEPRPAIARPRIFPLSVSRPFMAFAIASALLQGGTAIAGPFFGVWFVRDLHFDYLELAINAAAMISGTIVFLPFWGRATDHSGNLAVMRVTALMVSVIPIPYLFMDHPHGIWLTNFYSGLAWSGYNIGCFNHLLEASGTKSTDRHISVFVALNGLFVFAFGLFGGFLATRVPELFGWKLRTLFLLSSAVRLLAVPLLFRLVKPAAGPGRLPSASQPQDSLHDTRIYP